MGSLAIAPSNVRAIALLQTAELLQSVSSAVMALSNEQRTNSANTTQAQINESLVAFDHSPFPQCNESGLVYLEGIRGQLVSSVTIQVAGSLGAQWLTFVSGTSLSDVAAAINTLTGATGVQAQQAGVNSDRAEISSTLAGIDQFTCVAQTSGKQPIVFGQPVGGDAMFSHADYGCALGLPACSVSSEVFLSAGANLNLHGHGELDLQIHGNFGIQQFTFASGTAQVNIVAAINSLMEYTGVVAKASHVNPERVRFASILTGSESFVRVRYADYPWGLLAGTPFGMAASNDMMDRGRDAVLGDANCDWNVNAADVVQVTSWWGACPTYSQPCPADVNGDGVVNIHDLWRVIMSWGATG